MTLRLGVVADLHHTPDPPRDLAYHNPFDIPNGLPRLRRAIDWFADQHVDTLVLAGDLSHNGRPSELRTVLATAASRWPGPILAVAGNHDTLESHDALSDAIADLGDARITLPGPRGLAFRDLRVAGLDQPKPDLSTATPAWGSDVVILISHFPLFSREQALVERGLRYAGDLTDHASAAHALRRRRAPTIVINGHLHARDTYLEGPSLQLSVAALVEPPFEATIVEIHAATATHVRRRARPMSLSTSQSSLVLAPSDEAITLNARSCARQFPT